tara:strand:- start:1258 stop:1434 length:177 start_codon:yes stop_codon:yes gene_type:complete
MVMNEEAVEDQIKELKELGIEVSKSNNNDVHIEDVFIRNECLSLILEAVRVTDKLYNS